MSIKYSEEQERFWAFIRAREAMRVNKTLTLSGPYSEDPILAEFHFCNANREDDYVTRWVEKHVRLRYHSRTLKFMVLQLLVARVFNEPRCLERILPFKSAGELKRELAETKKQGIPTFRGAYLMVPHGKRMKAHVYFPVMLQLARDSLETQIANNSGGSTTRSLEGVAEILQRIEGVGPFLANQVCTDLRYTRHKWADWDTFVLAGPGTQRGLNRFYGRPVDQHRTQKLLSMELRILRNYAPKEFTTLFRDINNLANCFCEFDKYRRAQGQQAAGQTVRLKRKYRPNPTTV